MALGGGRWPWRTDGQGRTILDILPRWLRFATGGLLIAMATGCMMIANVSHDPERWHVDPTAAERTGKPNDYLAAPEDATAAPVDRVLEGWPEAPGDLLARFDRIVREAPRTEVVAGSVDGGFVTYVQRTAIVGFPDYVSVKALPAEGGASLAIWSRSRYGYSDMGVNRARVERWLEALGAP